jgi:methylenetetrahydrofolate dehydrogenase (NADP+)/methenyltetrahydrofolate cyclohydrolase
MYWLGMIPVKLSRKKALPVLCLSAIMILDGKNFSENLTKKLRQKILALKEKPCLLIVQVGDNGESSTYIKHKKILGEKIGTKVIHEKFEKGMTERELLEKIKKWNKDKDIHGILVQMPLPKHLDKNKIIDAVSPLKDVDGLTSFNQKMLMGGKSFLLPATPKGIFSLLSGYKIPIEGKKVVVVGRSTLVGIPAALLALSKNATVTICHSKTKNLSKICKEADILIVAIGRPKFIGKKFISKKTVIIDVGINFVPLGASNAKLVGDTDFEKVKNLVRAITPVPGGVGPMTAVSLFENLLVAYKNQKQMV